MKTYNASISNSNYPTVQSGLDRVSLIIGLIALVVSVGAGLAVGRFGALVLMVIPVIVFLVVAFAQPNYGLSFFIFITASQVSNVGIKFYGAPSLAQPLAALLISVIVLRILLYRERPLNWGKAAPVLIIYVLALFISMFMAVDYTISSLAFIGFVKDAIGGVIVILLIQRPDSFRQAAWALILAGIFMGSISSFQAITRTYDNPYSGFGRWESQSSGQQSRNRSTGPYDNPNAFSQVMAVMFSFSLERLWHEKRTLLRLIAGWGAVVCSLTVVFTYSRGGVLTLLATLGVLFLQDRPRLLPVLITILIAFGLIQLLPADYTSHISTLQDIIPSQNDNQIYDSSFRGRLSENIAALRMFTDEPFFGVGLGNFEVRYQDYSRQIGLDVRRVPRSPASLYLEVLSEQGLLGTIVFALLLYTVISGLITARVKYLHIGMLDHANMTMALIAGFVGYMIQATVKNSAYSNVYWILIGMAVSASQLAVFSAQEKDELAQSH